MDEDVELGFSGLVAHDVTGKVPCECCDEGVSFTTGRVCIACDGFGWREP